MSDHPLFERHPNNPLLTQKDSPVPCKSFCNPAAARVGEDVLLLARAIDDQDHSQLVVARSRNGVDGWRIEKTPLLAPANKDDQSNRNEWYDTLGCEDPRMTYLPERGEYLITYVGNSPFGAGVCLATTKDFRNSERLGIIIPPYDKDAVLFPRQIGGRYLILHRPTINGLENIWLMESDDLLHWGRPVCVMQKGESGWDSGKIGSGPPPIETPEGWLLVFHGAEETPQGWVYKVGLALLDRDDPSKLIARTKMPVFGPDAPYEVGGVKPGIVFPTGLVQQGDDISLYYGADDGGIALATTSVSRLLQAVKAG
ncbi:MAG: glycosidase [Armatimonadetes bacterium]|nr:glycosidase [Armatimonadota bacterium]